MDAKLITLITKHANELAKERGYAVTVAEWQTRLILEAHQQTEIILDAMRAVSAETGELPEKKAD